MNTAMQDCIFCKIVRGDIDAAKIWEDDKFLAILDINPNTKAMTLVMPKAHYDSDAFAMPDEEYGVFMIAAKKVAQLLERALGVHRVALVMEGMGVNHAHLKLYPLYGLGEKFQETWAHERVFFDHYEGYISTQLGPAANLEELKKLAEEIIKKSNVKSQKSK